MNFIKRKINFKSLLAIAIIVVASACEDTSRAPVVTYDSAGKGAYIRLVSQSGALLINILTQSAFNASKYTYSVEFVDGAGGARVTDYILTVEFKAANGTSKAPVELRKFPASGFTKMESGRLGVGDITVTSADVASKFGLTYNDLKPGDRFIITGALVTKDNGTFTSTNSSATVRGTAFQGHFDFTMPASCPSSLQGTYNYSSSDIWCNGGTKTGTVNIVALGGGKYSFSDWSFGGYPVCYGGNAAGWGSLSFTDVCAKVSFTGFTDNYGDTWTFSSSISGNNWNITWSNTYGESGKTSITFPSGVPFTL